VRLPGAALLAAMSLACVRAPPQAAGGEHTGLAPTSFRLTSVALTDGGEVPEAHACVDGDHLGQSPDLRWTEPPAGTRALALSVIDTSADGFVHWMVLNLDPSLRMLEAGASHGEGLARALELSNDFGKPGYGGPCPPAGTQHVYVFSVYALPEPVAGFAAGQKAPRELDERLRSQALGMARLAATYER
jgi:hypothetical protein